MKITFLGAVGEVTGSRYLLENEDKKILIDCGAFQGNEELYKRNWEKFPLEPSTIEAIILTHAHIDHIGYIPALINHGFRGTIYCSQATYALSSLLLVDYASIEEEAAKDKSTDHFKAKPLYTVIDAEHSLSYFKVVDYDKELKIGSLIITLIRSGHVLGSSFVAISDGKKILTFSGDLGRPNQLILKPPTHIKQTDFLILESTYGDRLHSKTDPIKKLGELINKTVARGGSIIIPAFALDRTEKVLYCLYQLKEKKLIPSLPIFLDSPLAIRIINLWCNFPDELTLSHTLCNDVMKLPTYITNEKQSRRLNYLKHPIILIAGSGMATGGRVLDHFTHFISDEKNSIVFVGYQAKDTLGRELVDGAQEVTIYDKLYKVHAEIDMIDNFSAHADYNEILEWLSYFEKKPQTVFLTHGEAHSSQSLKKKIEDRFGWSVVIPSYLQSFELD